MQPWGERTDVGSEDESQNTVPKAWGYKAERKTISLGSEWYSRLQVSEAPFWQWDSHSQLGPLHQLLNNTEDMVSTLDRRTHFASSCTHSFSQLDWDNLWQEVYMLCLVFSEKKLAFCSHMANEKTKTTIFSGRQKARLLEKYWLSKPFPWEQDYTDTGQWKVPTEIYRT